MIHYLKFDSLQHAITAILSNEPELLWDDNGTYRIKGSHDFSISLIGTLFRTTGNMITLENGETVPETAHVQGYHVNVNAVNRPLPDYLKAFEVFPVTPSVNFGD